MLHNTPTNWLESNNPSLYKSQRDSNTNGFVATAIVFLATGAVLVATRRRRTISA